MAKQKLQQVLEIDPLHELKFQGPFSDVVTSYLKLHNPSSQKVCFKVKTTAPRRYCVRPNSGLVEPLATVDVSVMLQPSDGDSQNDRGKHKFMVQSMFAPETVEDIDSLWSEAKSSDLMDSKLRCVFEEPEEVDEEVEAGVDVQEVNVSAPSSFEPVITKEPSTNQDELSSIMEECKRLTSENSRLKQLYDEAKSKIKPDALTNDSLLQLKSQYTMYISVAFVVGLVMGMIVLGIF